MTKKEYNDLYREEQKKKLCEQVIALARLCTVEGGGDVKFIPATTPYLKTETKKIKE